MSHIKDDIKQRLELLLPYIISSERLKWQPFYIICKVNTYSRDVLTAIVGLGVVPPVFGLISNALSGKEFGKGEAQNIFATLAPAWLIVVLLVVIFSAVMRVYVTTEQVEKRAVLARSCRNEFRALSSRLHFALQTNDPKSEIIQIQNEVTKTVHRHITEESWPWLGHAPGTDAQGKVQAQSLCDNYGRVWTQTLERAESREE